MSGGRPKYIDDGDEVLEIVTGCRVKRDVRSGNGQGTKPVFEERAPRLIGSIRQEETSKRFGEVAIVEQPQSASRTSAEQRRESGLLDDGRAEFA